MEQEKHKNSDTSSGESDHNQPEKPNEDNAAASSAARSYECTFCKRGFTNAQALGGHMNIHRKDKAKAKAKQKNRDDSSIDHHNFKSNENYKNLSYSPQISSTDCNLVFGGHVNYQVYLPSSNHGFQTGNYQYSNYFPVERPDHLKDHNMDANLSLKIGLSPPVEDEQEVDLELRLGQYVP